uniref:Uncharacterized protein n=1 Tax=Plectus sambesii TaxID=2011161 RepID=A0A914V3K9_9BILA
MCDYFRFDKDWTNQFDMDMDIEMDGADQKTPKIDSSLNTPVIASAPNATVRRRVKFSEMSPDQIAFTENRDVRRVPSWSDLTAVDASSVSPVPLYIECRCGERKRNAAVLTSERACVVMDGKGAWMLLGLRQARLRRALWAVSCALLCFATTTARMATTCAAVYDRAAISGPVRSVEFRGVRAAGRLSLCSVVFSGAQRPCAYERAH